MFSARWFTLLLLATAVVLGGVLHSHAQQTKPNILFIVADDHGYGDIGAYGGGEGRGMPTPNLDRLAKEEEETTAAAATNGHLRSIPKACCTPHDTARDTITDAALQELTILKGETEDLRLVRRAERVGRLVQASRQQLRLIR